MLQASSPQVPDVGAAGRDLRILIEHRGVTGFGPLIVEASEAYRAHLLTVVRSNRSHHLRAAADALYESIGLALEAGPDLSVPAVPFTASCLDGVQEAERSELLDQCQLGFGCDQAPIVVVGTEQGWNLGDDLAFSLSHCSVNTLWLTRSPASLVLRIAGRDDWSPGARPFIVLPADYYGQHPRRRTGRDTSNVLAEILEFAIGWRPVSGFLKAGAAEPCFGDLTYMLDLNISPAQYHLASSRPTPERVAFLSRLFEHLRSRARAVVFYGKRDPALDEMRDKLAALFLGRPVERSNVEGVARPTQVHRGADGRVVIFTAPLNYTVPRTHSQALAALMRPALGGLDLSWAQTSGN